MDIAKLESLIIKAVPDSQVMIKDPNHDGRHFEAWVISDSFQGLSLVKQHMMVMKALKSEFDTDSLHALGLKTFTKATYESYHGV